MIQIIFWTLATMCSVLGMVLIPIYPVLGTVVAIGCFLIVAIDIARNFKADCNSFYQAILFAGQMASALVK